MSNMYDSQASLPPTAILGATGSQQQDRRNSVSCPPQQKGGSAPEEPSSTRRLPSIVSGAPAPAHSGPRQPPSQAYANEPPAQHQRRPSQQRHPQHMQSEGEIPTNTNDHITSSSVSGSSSTVNSNSGSPTSRQFRRSSHPPPRSPETATIVQPGPPPPPPEATSSGPETSTAAPVARRATIRPPAAGTNSTSLSRSHSSSHSSSHSPTVVGGIPNVNLESSLQQELEDMSQVNLDKQIFTCYLGEDDPALGLQYLAFPDNAVNLMFPHPTEHTFNATAYQTAAQQSLQALHAATLRPLFPNTTSEPVRYRRELGPDGNPVSVGHEIKVLNEKHKAEFLQLKPAIVRSLQGIINCHKMKLPFVAADERKEWDRFNTNPQHLRRPLHEFMSAVCSQLCFSPSSLLGALILLDRLCYRCPTLICSETNIRTIFFVLLRLSTKTMELRSLPNNHFCRELRDFQIVRCDELNKMEAELFMRLRFDVLIRPEYFGVYSRRLSYQVQPQGQPQPQSQSQHPPAAPQTNTQQPSPPSTQQTLISPHHHHHHHHHQQQPNTSSIVQPPPQSSLNHPPASK